jgi:hypothetical protein
VWNSAEQVTRAPSPNTKQRRAETDVSQKYYLTTPTKFGKQANFYIK